MIELDDLLKAAAGHGAELIGSAFSRRFAAFSPDSRTIAPGQLFVALRTDKADGHDFIADAVANGAAGVLCERVPPNIGARAVDVTTIRVTDTRAALLDWAAYALASIRPYRIAVAGSVGKSAACAALRRVLESAGDVPRVFSNGNRNDELGIPIALGELGPEHKLALLELAAGSAAELHRLGALVRPDALVLTSVGQGARDAAAMAIDGGLLGLLAMLQPDGRLVLNGDDASLLRAVAECIPAGSQLRYGLDEGNDVRGAVLEASAVGTRVMARYGGASAVVTLSAPSTGAVYAALAALATAVVLGEGFEQAAVRLNGLPAEAGRLSPLPGLAGRTVLDDSFSAGDASLRLALRTMSLFPAPHIAVLGEISGVHHADALDVDTLDRLLNLDCLVLEGATASTLGRELRARSPSPERIVLTYSARVSADAVCACNPLATPAAGCPGQTPATVLVKGSDAARMERVVELLLPEGAPAREMLVRQDEGWRRRTYIPNERPTWVEVDLDAIRANLQAVRAAAAPAAVMAVLKADAYGHGARWVARTAVLNGAAMLGVASLNEALDLRADGITAPILILGYSPPWQARDLAISDIRATIFSYPIAEHFSRVAQDLGRRITVHIKVDTGMTRLGVLPEEAVAFVGAVAALPGLEVEGIFSHLATSDSDVEFVREQGALFDGLLARFAEQGRSFRYVHLENSAAVLRHLPYAYNLVRVGLALYGLRPCADAGPEIGLRPALAFKTRVAQVKRVPAGTSVSYGRTFVTARDSRIAVLPVGYGDGFRRSPANWGEVLVRGRRAPLAGPVCMDMTMVDVTAIDGVQEGDEVVLIGRQGEAAITAEDVAASLGTIPYEVICQILPRVPRQTR
jgi:alanine racemase